MSRKFILGALAFAFALAVTGCGGSDGDAWDSRLNGTWATTGGGTTVTFVFNNGTATMNFGAGMSPIYTAATSGNVLTLTPRHAGGSTTVFTYSISGNTLTLTDDNNDTITLQRQGS
jgi:uncharacterized protein YndB with AHSA1/START domain